MTKIIIGLLLSFIPVTLVAQDADVLEKLKAYDFETAFLTTTLKDADAEHAFNMRSKISSLKDTTIEEIEFDPRRPVGDRWKLISVNGSVPSEDDLREFDHSHNTKGVMVNAEVDETSLKINEENEEYLVVSFKYKKESLPVKFQFLHACNGLAYVNKKSKKLEKAYFSNTEQIRVRGMRVNILKMDVVYEFYPSENLYHISDEKLKMGTYYHGMLYDVTVENHYSEIKKIK